VNVDIANYSDYDFNGIFDVSLYDLNGDFVATVEELSNASLYSGYYNGYTFTANSLNVDPGTYLLAVMHKWDGYDYELTGSKAEYINPVKVIVKEAPFQKDGYESNDFIEDAYNFDLSFSNNSAHVITTGSNIHVGNDWDFYSVDLASGYNYAINARLHDAYNSGNGNEYSVDGLFLYSTDGGENWSDIFDDLMPSAVTVTGGKKMLFVVSPYFLGERGSYLFDISIQRGAPNAVETIDENQNMVVFPNPAIDKVYITSDDELQKFKLFDIQGRLLREEQIKGRKHVLEVSNLEKGNYVLTIESTNYTQTEKLVKQ
jgi:hypothetical protein